MVTGVFMDNDGTNIATIAVLSEKREIKIIEGDYFPTCVLIQLSKKDLIKLRDEINGLLKVVK